MNNPWEAKPGEWRPRLDDTVMYFDLFDKVWKRGKLHSYEGRDYVAVDMANGSRGRFYLSQLKQP